MDQYQRAEFLVETDWLAANLNETNLRIFDCGARPAPNPDELQRKKYPLKPKSGRALFEKKHIPGANHIDVPGDLSDENSELPLMMPPVKQMAAALAAAGISDNSHVVLYSSTSPMWATRVWWMLRAVGFENTSILNGGIAKWVAEDRPVSDVVSPYAPGKFTAGQNNKLLVDKKYVHKAIDNSDITLIHALTPSVYDGSNDSLVFGRRGRIPGSINIPSELLYDQDTGVYLPHPALRTVFEKAGCCTNNEIIIYCGGGINATLDAFALMLIGYENISVYDGSMCEWGNDHSLPIEFK
ncbi:MAG: sulfurtransferase [Emcibacter sp.]|nr:sulfurtransferase [Emcibacter sp.]